MLLWVHQFERTVCYTSENKTKIQRLVLLRVISHSGLDKRTHLSCLNPKCHHTILSHITKHHQLFVLLGSNPV